MGRVVLMFLVSLCFGIIGLVMWTGPVYAPPFNPPIGGFLECKANLNTCNANLAACEAQPAAAVPQTGQTTCWDTSRNVITCAGTGQDGDIQAGVVPPNPRFTDNGNGTITDNLTGLIWLKNANCFGTRTWALALTDANTLNSGECGLTDGSVDGDWYLPNRNELASLLDLENSNPALPTGYPFTEFQIYYYWSSTTAVPDPSYAWLVFFLGGTLFADFKTSSGFDAYVLPVRGGS